MIKRIIRKIKKYWYAIKGNEDALLAIKIKQFRDNGGKCGENFKFYCNMPTEPYLIEIGNDVTIAGETILLTHDNSVIKLGINVTDYFGKIKIGDSCFIGFRSTILPGVELGDNTIVGAGSVVTKSFPQGNVVICGNPAKILCTTEEFKNKKKDICINMDEGDRRSRKREFLSSLPYEMLEHK